MLRTRLLRGEFKSKRDNVNKTRMVGARTTFISKEIFVITAIAHIL
jgi:hypothetical protein